jgi:Amt family ammonium transporter
MLKLAQLSIQAGKAGKSRLRSTLGAALSCIFLLTAGLSAYGQDAAAPAPAAEAAAPAAEAAAPVTPEPGLAAYLGNGDPTGTAAEGLSGPGHNAWLMTSAAIVLFMTLPGLALFYGGLVRRKNVLSVLAQCLACAAIVPLLWWAVGYSLVFGKSFNSPFLGGTEFFLLKDVGGAPNTDYLYWIPQGTFAMFQLMFAIITPGLIVGAIAERMKFTAIVLFIVLWMFLVYIPLAHMVWGVTGFMNGPWSSLAGIGAIDFAGGTVVHMSSGWSALILCLILGPRVGFGKSPMAPHSMVLCMAGTGILWVGWYGFNAGSAGAADGIATQAFMTTTLCAGTAALVWALIEKILKKHASVLGFCSGVVAGLVVITPAAGFVSTTSAVIMGVIAGVACYLGAVVLKKALGYDDSLDTFGIHGVGGTIGAILTGVFADPSVNAVLNNDGLKGKVLVVEQLKAVVLTIIISAIATTIIAFILKFALGGLRPTAEEEETGLDITDHGEEGYVLD